MVMSPRPIRWKDLRPDEAERLIRTRAADSKNVIISMHACERLDERSSITDLDIYRILREGHVVDTPIRNAKGDWEAIIQKKINGGRDAAAVTIIFNSGEKVKVKTVMWIDP